MGGCPWLIPFSSLLEKRQPLMQTQGNLIWEDEQGEIDFDEDRMVKWFSMAIANLSAFDIPDDEQAWILFLMGAETAIRGNKGESEVGEGEA